MSSLSRMLSILDLFSSTRPTWSAEEILTELGFSHGTGYRYLKTLSDHGLISRSPKGFSLGPRLVELDYLSREGDPLLMASLPILQDLRKEVDGTVLLANFFKDRVIVSHHEAGTNPTVVSYGRGRRMPLFHGAGSKAIIAALPKARQKKLFDQHTAEIMAAGMGETWKVFRDNLSRIAKQGIVLSFAELDEGNVGVALAIKTNDTTRPASIVLVFSDRRYKTLDKSVLERALRLAVARIGDAIAWNALEDVTKR